MSSEEILRESETKALYNNQIVAKSSKKKFSSFGAVAFLIVIVATAAIIFSSGNLIPSAISERLIEETDVQYADAVESKKLVFQQALLDGNIPEDTAQILKAHGVTVGYISDGNFIEANQSNGPLVLKQQDKIITADNFIIEVKNNLELYNAFNLATYSRAAYYYDEPAQKVFDEIGTSRNNYKSDSDFNEIMDSLVGNGSDIDINNVVLEEKTTTDEKTGETKIIYEYVETGTSAKSDTAANSFIAAVGEKNKASNTNDATLNSADALKAADTITKEQRSSLFFVTFMENISKMKAGDGNDSKINDAMNYLYQKQETEVVNTKTGKVEKITGTPLDSPSLYAILSGSNLNVGAVSNFSSDRVADTIQNQLNTENDAVKNTVVSVNNKVKGSIGRFIDNGTADASIDILNSVETTIDESLVNNSFKIIRGINAGEFLVEGAVNVGKKLAKASGATAGDTAAVMVYQKINSDILAMDKKIDRINKSPFDITSKNTFLGSIFYSLAKISTKSNSILSGWTNLSKTVNTSIISLLPSSYADATNTYLTNFGECQTIESIGAVGSAQCAEIATFDTSTLNNPFNDPNFISFVNNNTTLNSAGVRTINDNSVLANFIIYNDERKTPIGIMDGGIIDSISTNSKSVGFMSDILKMITGFISADENSKRLASGAAFVNSSTNPDWQTYKYAQRYVSLARATDALKKYSSDSTAYQNIKYFEGEINPVTAFLESFYARNNNLMVPEVFN